MKYQSIVFVLSVLIFIGCKEAPKAVEKKEVVAQETPEKEVPTSTFQDLKGNPVELSDYKGKRVLLNFWATWCKPCVEEMPALLKAEVALADENYVFLLASDQSMDKIKAFKEKKGFEFKYIRYNGAMADYKINALPATFIYNTEGEEVERIDGATEWDAPEILEQLKGL